MKFERYIQNSIILSPSKVMQKRNKMLLIFIAKRLQEITVDNLNKFHIDNIQEIANSTGH